MSFVKDLFGGTEQQQTTGPVETTPEAFKALQGPIADVLKILFQGGQDPFTGVTDPSRFTAGLTGTEGGLVDRLGGLAGGSSALTSANDLLTQTLQGTFLRPESNPFLSAQIAAAQRPLIEQFQDIAMPRLISDFTAAGQRVNPGGSSAFDRSAALATRGLFNSLGDIATNLTGQNFQAERGRQQEAVTQAGQLSGQEIQNTIQGLQAVALPRLIEQFGIDRGLEEFNSRINVVLQAIQLAQGLPLFAQGQEGSGTSETSPNIVGTLLSPFSFAR